MPGSDKPDQTVQSALATLLNSAADLVKRARAEGHAEGYAAGFSAGSEAMRQHILTVAQVPAPLPQTSDDSRDMAIAAERLLAPRAPRGAVRAALMAVLSKHPDGMTEGELGLAANRHNPEVSPKSIGVELNRKRDRLYRNDGGRWFLITHSSETETAGSVPAVPFTLTTQEASDDTETTIAAIAA